MPDQLTEAGRSRGRS